MDSLFGVARSCDPQHIDVTLLIVQAKIIDFRILLHTVEAHETRLSPAQDSVGSRRFHVLKSTYPSAVRARSRSSAPITARVPVAR